MAYLINSGQPRYVEPGHYGFTVFAPPWPRPVVTTREDLCANLVHVRQEVIRWEASMSWPNDHVQPVHHAATRLAQLWRLVETVTTDANARQVQTLVEKALRNLATFARRIIYHPKERQRFSCAIWLCQMDLLQDLQSIDAFKFSTQDILFEVKETIHYAKSALLLGKNLPLGMAYYEGPVNWTRDELDAEEQELQQMRPMPVQFEHGKARASAGSRRKPRFPDIQQTVAIRSLFDAMSLPQEQHTADSDIPYDLHGLAEAIITNTARAHWY